MWLEMAMIRGVVDSLTSVAGIKDQDKEQLVVDGPGTVLYEPIP